MRLHRAVWQYIEHELFSYEQTQQDVEVLRGDIIGGSARPDGVGGQNGPGDPTGAKAVKLVSSPALAQMERTIRAIDKALQQLSEDHRLIYELRYRQGLSWEQVCMEIPISRRQYFKQRRDLILIVGANLGLVNYVEVAVGKSMH